MATYLLIVVIAKHRHAAFMQVIPPPRGQTNHRNEPY